MSKRDKQDQFETVPNRGRRRFMQGLVGAVVAGTAGGKIGRTLTGMYDSSHVRGPEAAPASVLLKINGKAHALSLPQQRTLLLALREDLGLTGTKKGCNLGQCGACTVLMDNLPVYACMVLASDAVGREITTIEGLQKGDRLHPVQAQFIKQMGSQCGHCTSGMIMAGAALLVANPSPSESDVKRALSGNLCRCGNYKNEVTAVLLASGDGGKSNGTQEAAKYLDSMAPALDGYEKATGRARYSGDLGFHRDDPFHSPLYAKVIRSPYPHAQVVTIDDDAAQRLSGYLGMVTWRDVPKYLSDRQFLTQHARYVGDAVAAVAAENQYTAEKAAALIKVLWKPLQPWPNAEENLESDNREIHKDGVVAGFMGPQPAHIPTLEYRLGDTKIGLAEADLVVTGRYTTPIQCPVPIEPHCCTAYWERDSLHLWDSQQSIYEARDIVAGVFGIKASQVYVHCEYVGGAFGSKDADSPSKPLYQAIAALLAKKTRRPVRLEHTLTEEILAEDTRNPFIFEMKTGVKKDGTLTAIECRTVQPTGGYTSVGPDVLAYAGMEIINSYRVNHLWFHGYSVYTNSSVGGEMHGFGAIQACFAREMHMAKVADALQMNPLDFLTKNVLREGDPGPLELFGELFSSPQSSTPSYVRTSKMRAVGSLECLRQGAEAIVWNRWRHPSQKAGRKRRGLGIYACQQDGGRGASNGLVWIDKQGKIHVPLATGNVGTASQTGIATLVAQVLNVSVGDLDVTWGDTSETPWDSSSDSSRGLSCHGKATYNAAMDILQQLRHLGSIMLQVPEEKVEIREGRVIARGEAKSFDFAAIAKPAPLRNDFTPFYDPAVDLGLVSNGTRNSKPELDPATIRLAQRCVNRGGIVGLGYYEFNPLTQPWGASFAEIEVDMTTGQVEILKVVSVQDVGRVIYRRGAEAQMRGGAAMGIGFAMSEDIGVDPNTLVPIYTNLHQYRPMTVLDYPDLSPILLEVQGGPGGPYGAKGLGDNAILFAPGAIGTAIYNATGVWITELPYTPSRVYAALKKAGRLES